MQRQKELSNVEKNAIWLLENNSSMYDEQSVEALTGINKFGLRKLKTLASTDKRPGLRSEPTISALHHRIEVAETKKRRELVKRRHAKLERSETKPGKLPKYNPVDDK